MNEEYYTPLTEEQIDKYLARIGMQRPEKLDKQYLDKLVLAHQCSVVFENLDICAYDRPISLAIADLFDKIVNRGRGGYCFELNGLFVKLLQGLGYDAYSCACRGTMGSIDTPGAAMHRGNVVRLSDGKRVFCDVGYGGPMPPGAIEFVEGVRQVVDGETFWFTQISEFQWLLRRMTKGTSESGMLGPYDEKTVNEIKEVDVQLVGIADWYPTDFLAPNNTMSVGENAGFRKRYMLSLRRPDGSYGMSSDVFTIIKNGVRTRRAITPEEIPQILEEYFHLNEKM